MKRILLAIPIFFIFASTASAYPKPTGNVCTTQAVPVCHNIEATDVYIDSTTHVNNNGNGYWNTGTGARTLKQTGCTYIYKSKDVWIQSGSPVSTVTCVFVGFDVHGNVFKKYLYPSALTVDPNAFQPISELWVSNYYVDGFLTQSAVSVTKYTPRLESYCTYYTAKDDNGNFIKGVGLTRTPDDIFKDCKFTSRADDYQTTTSTTPKPEVGKPTTDTPPKPVLKNCKTITIDGDKFKLQAKQVTCLRARKLARTLYDDPDNKNFTLEEDDEYFLWTHKKNKTQIKLTIQD